jgi:plasmid stabilization system protein ParE
MPRNEVRFSRQARGDLKSITENIAEHNPRAAEPIRRLLFEKAFSFASIPNGERA